MGGETMETRKQHENGGRTWGAALKEKVRSSDCVSRSNHFHISAMFGGMGGRAVGSDMIYYIVNERMIEGTKEPGKVALCTVPANEYLGDAEMRTL